MGLFSNLFKKKNTNSDANVYVSHAQTQVPEVHDILELGQFMDSLLTCTRYVARSEYLNRFIDYQRCSGYFDVLRSSGMLNDFCSKNGLSVAQVDTICSRYKTFDALVDEHNEQFIKIQMSQQKDYLDNILKDCDPNIMLDDDQRKVVLTDEDYCLVVAGAGTGKTTTVAAKVKYLVEKKGINPSQILVVSFTNKAVNELKQRIVGELHIECPIATFHSAGNAILRKQSDEKLNIVDNWKLYSVVQDYFRGTVLKKESMVNNLILFFASYFDAPYVGSDLNAFFNNLAKSNYSTMRSELDDFQRNIIDTRTKKSVTIQSEVMRSSQEVEIANFLYLNNLDYEYEPLYQYDIAFARKPYTPDFIIRQGEKVAYIEHFGVTEEGRNNRYSRDELETYKKAIKDKIALHNQHGTTLIYTFSSYKDGRSISEHLKEKLEISGFILAPRSNQEVIEKLVTSEENRYTRKLVSLICRFIQNFKTNGFTADDFKRMSDSTDNVRSKLFLDICRDCYVEYQHYLKENDAVDFEDMINESARILREVSDMKKKLDFKYIIVDEYQDISRQRFDLVSALHNVTNAKIIAVGDDWQSIYAFSGSDITLFTHFAEKMGYAKLLKIVRTYRNSQEVIDIAGSFIQQNPEQIQKELISNKTITDPVIIYTYDSTRKDSKGDNRSGANYALAHAVEIAIEQIIAYNKSEGKSRDSSILMLGRFGFDGDMLEKSGLFEYVRRGNKIRSVKYPRLNIDFMTAHASKGLGYDNVIIINGRNETYGFPSKIEDDPVLSFVIHGDKSIDYAEERRLFYVAMTRTKNRVFFVAPKQNPSEFLLEIKRDYKNVTLRGEWNENTERTQSFKKICPFCGYPLQYRYKNAYGLKLFICTNEPEVCSFITNEYKARKMSIIKCDKCRDGYLVVRPGKNDDHILGCTNYKNDGTGCNRIMSQKYFYEYMGITDDKPVYEIHKAASEKKAVIKSDSKVQVSATITVENQELDGQEFKELAHVMYDDFDLSLVVPTILNCLNSISAEHYYGVSVLTDVLRGSESQKVVKAGLNQVCEYGELRDMKREDVSAIINWLIDNTFILQTTGKYPVLHPTYNGMHCQQTLTNAILKKIKKYLEDDE